MGGAQAGISPMPAVALVLYTYILGLSQGAFQLAHLAWELGAFVRDAIKRIDPRGTVRSKRLSPQRGTSAQPRRALDKTSF
jgi:hypothetical protein